MRERTGTWNPPLEQALTTKGKNLTLEKDMRDRFPSPSAVSRTVHDFGFREKIFLRGGEAELRSGKPRLIFASPRRTDGCNGGGTVDFHFASLPSECKRFGSETAKGPRLLAAPSYCGVDVGLDLFDSVDESLQLAAAAWVAKFA